MFGAPGVGKGTFAARIAEHTGAVHISTGEIFRANIKNETELGLKVKAILDAGQYVPDELTNEILLDAVSKPEIAEKGWILDGYPRTIGQVEFLIEKGIINLDDANFLTVLLDADLDLTVKRLVARGRADDKEEIIRDRYNVYKNESAPLIDKIIPNADDKSKVVEVQTNGTMDEVWTEIKTQIEAKK